MNDIRKHKRVNDILLGPLERPALQWLSAHMPAWVNPDILTAVGVFGSVVIFISYALTNLHPAFLWLASLGFVVNWFGDSLDGTLARFRKIERPKYGFFVDHTMDALSEALVFLGLGLTPFVRFDLACLALIGYFLMSILAFVRTCVDGKFRLSYIRLGPTEMRLIAILANTLIFFIGNPILRLPLVTLTVYDLIVTAITLLLMGVFLVSTIRQAIELSKLEALPQGVPLGQPEK